MRFKITYKVGYVGMFDDATQRDCIMLAKSQVDALQAFGVMHRYDEVLTVEVLI